jgi:hypothetical protein
VSTGGDRCHLDVAAQALLTYGFIFYSRPGAGLGLLDVAGNLADLGSYTGEVASSVDRRSGQGIVLPAPSPS